MSVVLPPTWKSARFAVRVPQLAADELPPNTRLKLAGAAIQFHLCARCHSVTIPRCVAPAESAPAA